MSGPEAVIGLALSVAGVASLFTSCVECFNMVQLGRQQHRDFRILDQKLENQKDRFFLWGRSLGLDLPGVAAHLETNTAGVDDAVDTNIQNIVKTMKLIVELFNRSEKFKSRYEVVAEESSDAQLISLAGNGGASLKNMLQRFRKQALSTASKGEAKMGVVRWVIEDQANLQALEAHLRDFIDDLGNLTSSQKWSEWKTYIFVSRNELNASPRQKEVEEDELEFRSASYCGERQPFIISGDTALPPLTLLSSTKERGGPSTDAPLRPTRHLEDSTKEVFEIEDPQYDKLLDALAFDEMGSREANVDEACADTFEWIFSPDSDAGSWDNFSKWLENGEGFYWVSGKAGSGKSTLMNFIIAHSTTKSLLNKWADGKPLFHASWFFWKPGSELQKSIRGFLRAIVHSFLEQEPGRARSVLALLSRTQTSALNRGRPLAWSESQLKAMILEILKDEKSCYSIFVDGLDEMEGDRLGLLDFLRELGERKNVKFCISSRPEPLVSTSRSLSDYLSFLISQFEHHFKASMQLKLHDLTMNDMETLIQRRLDTIYAIQGSRDISYNHGYLIHLMMMHAQGVFLWVKIMVQDVIEAILNGDSREDLVKRLISTPVELEDLFKHILDRIDRIHRSKASKYFQLILSWDEAAKSPAKTLDLSLAACDAVQYGGLEGLANVTRRFADQKALNLEAGLFARTGGLLELIGLDDSKPVPDGAIDKRKSVLYSPWGVVFLHRSVSEFFSDPKNWPEWMIPIPAPEIQKCILSVYFLPRFQWQLQAHGLNFDSCSYLREFLGFLASKQQLLGPHYIERLLNHLHALIEAANPPREWPALVLFEDCTADEVIYPVVTRDMSGIATWFGLYQYSKNILETLTGADQQDAASYLLHVLESSFCRVSDPERTAFIEYLQQSGANPNTSFDSVWWYRCRLSRCRSDVSAVVLASMLGTRNGGLEKNRHRLIIDGINPNAVRTFRVAPVLLSSPFERLASIANGQQSWMEVECTLSLRDASYFIDLNHGSRGFSINPERITGLVVRKLIMCSQTRNFDIGKLNCDLYGGTTEVALTTEESALLSPLFYSRLALGGAYADPSVLLFQYVIAHILSYHFPRRCQLADIEPCDGNIFWLIQSERFFRTAFCEFGKAHRLAWDEDVHLNGCPLVARIVEARILEWYFGSLAFKSFVRERRIQVSVKEKIDIWWPTTHWAKMLDGTFTGSTEKQRSRLLKLIDESPFIKDSKWAKAAEPMRQWALQS